MLYEQVREHIARLSDGELLEYVLTGQRIYEPEAVAFAKEELGRRNIVPEELAALRAPIEAALARHDIFSPDLLTRPTDGRAVVCERCGLEAPTRYVEYHQNMGALVMRFSRTYSGCFCRSCNHRSFRDATLITLFLGWWGVISIIVAPCFILLNLITFLRTLSLPPVPEGACIPRIGESDIARVVPYLPIIDERMANGGELHGISRELAPQIGLTPGQVWYCIHCILENRAGPLPQAQPVSHGFPVIPIPPSRSE